MHIKKGDTVLLLSGKCKKKEGVVLKVLKDRILVSGMNMCKKHVKGNPNQNIVSSIVEKEAFLHISNVRRVEK